MPYLLLPESSKGIILFFIPKQFLFSNFTKFQDKKKKKKVFCATEMWFLNKVGCDEVLNIVLI